jgi:hypothetical protein
MTFGLRVSLPISLPKGSSTKRPIARNQISYSSQPLYQPLYLRKNYLNRSKAKDKFQGKKQFAEPVLSHRRSAVLLILGILQNFVRFPTNQSDESK